MAFLIIPKSAKVNGVSLKLIKKLFVMPKIIQTNEHKLNANNLLLNRKHGLKITDIISALYRNILKKCLKKLYAASILPRENHSITNTKNKAYSAKSTTFKIVCLLINFLIIFPPIINIF